MSHSLYDILTSDISDYYQTSKRLSHDDMVASITKNLTQLLNSRQESIQHLPDYGLPDLGAMYRGMPDSVDDLRTHIQDVVSKYEPRLSRVRARPHFSESDGLRLLLIITAELNGERIRFSTTFESDRHVEVERYVRPE